MKHLGVEFGAISAMFMLNLHFFKTTGVRARVATGILFEFLRGGIPEEAKRDIKGASFSELFQGPTSRLLNETGFATFYKLNFNSRILSSLSRFATLRRMLRFLVWV